MQLKVRVPRWLTSEIAEYDTANKFWITRQVGLEILPFSCAIYGDEKIAIVGGLDDSVVNKP
jgi:hypothetical protein